MGCDFFVFFPLAYVCVHACVCYLRCWLIREYRGTAFRVGKRGTSFFLFYAGTWEGSSVVVMRAVLISGGRGMLVAAQIHGNIVMPTIYC